LLFSGRFAALRSFMNSPLNRRHFLRSSTALVALPFLESLGFHRFASAAYTGHDARGWRSGTVDSTG